MKRFILVFSFLFIGWASAQKLHTVKQSETPYGISKTYGLTLDEFYQLNPTIKDGVISIGDQLVVSKKSPVNTASEKNGQIVLLPKQTIYGITKQYHITEAELRKLNPDLDNHMKIGDKITLPLIKITKYGKDQPIAKEETIISEPTPSIDFNNAPTYTSTSVVNDYLLYTVQSGDSTFGIVKKFNVTLEELVKLNPQLSSGLSAGMVLKIKKIAPSYVKTSGSALNLVLMLPYGYESNDTKYRDLALEFTMGAKLAIERNAKYGKKLNVKFIDAGNETSFKNSLAKIDLEATDLIIGPLFKPNLIEVLNHVKEKKIPVVAPFANSSDLHQYQNLIIVETDDHIYAEKIAEEVFNVYTSEKIYIVSGADKKYASAMKNIIQQKLKSAVVEIIDDSSQLKLDTNMMTGQDAPIIAILAEENSTEGAAFCNKLIELSKKIQGVKAFSMYYVPSFDSKINDLTALHLVYLMDRKINTDGEFEKEILADYKSKYCKSPTKYSTIGFDVVNDMLSRENDKGEIFKQITKSQTQLATKFEFVRVIPNGAYTNTGFRVVRLEP